MGDHFCCCLLLYFPNAYLHAVLVHRSIEWTPRELENKFEPLGTDESMVHFDLRFCVAVFRFRLAAIRVNFDAEKSGGENERLNCGYVDTCNFFFSSFPLLFGARVALLTSCAYIYMVCV